MIYLIHAEAVQAIEAIATRQRSTGRSQPQLLEADEVLDALSKASRDTADSFTAPKGTTPLVRNPEMYGWQPKVGGIEQGP